MNSFRHRRVIVFFAAWCLSYVTQSDMGLAVNPPNIVLIMLDDVGYSDYGCFGGEIDTPNIDRLASEGIRFTQFYNNAICVPTRASLLTGLYPRYVGPNHRIECSMRMITVAEVLKGAGYQTSLSGKWHLGREAPHRPNDRGFDEFFGMLDGCSNHFDPAIPDPPFEGGSLRTWARNGERINKFPAEFYSTDAITDHAIECLRRYAQTGKPFFTHVCYTAAHSPLHAKPADIAKYRGKYAAGWDEMRKRRRLRQLELGAVPGSWGVAPREPDFPAWDDEPLKAWHENLMAVYSAMVDCLDQNIGRILQTLEDIKVGEETVVILLNDNGGCAEQAGGDDEGNMAGPKDFYVSCGAGWAYLQNTPFRRYKGWVHEGGIATPLVVKWPGVTKPGSKSDQVGHVIDLLPTICEIAQAAIPKEYGGRSLIPVEGISLTSSLRGQPVDRREPLFWKAFDNRAVRNGTWKLVRDQTVGRWELYDMLTDRTETKDLSGEQPERVRQMEADWNKWAEATSANLARESKYDLKRVPLDLKPITIALIGDSTMATYSKPPSDRPTLTGWGQIFGEFFGDNVAVRNFAQSGRSSKSFLSEGRWNPVLTAKPDYVFIQFGHNDQPGKGDRATDPNGDFQSNLKKYVADARSAGIQPVLVTPVARRIFADGKAQTSLTPYADAMKLVAAETKTPLVDLHAISLAMFDALGDEGSAFMSPSPEDRSHFSMRGAREIAQLVSQSVSRTVPALRPYQRQPWQVPK